MNQFADAETYSLAIYRRLELAGFPTKQQSRGAPFTSGLCWLAGEVARIQLDVEYYRCLMV